MSNADTDVSTHVAQVDTTTLDRAVKTAVDGVRVYLMGELNDTDHTLRAELTRVEAQLRSEYATALTTLQAGIDSIRVPTLGQVFARSVAEVTESVRQRYREMVTAHRPAVASLAKRKTQPRSQVGAGSFTEP